MALLAVLPGCEAAAPPPDARPAAADGGAGAARPSGDAASGPLRLEVRVLAERPHDPEAFTQGLVLVDGRLYESTGGYGSSSLREVDAASGRVNRAVELAPDLFGEGLAAVGDRLLLLTWREGRALLYERRSFDRVGEHAYRGEGWGLCHDGERLYMSDGTSTLTVREPSTFEVLSRLPVTLESRPLAGLNELECAEGWVYANVWQSDSLVRIDPQSGEVLAVVDAAGLLSAEERGGTDVLNGIAYDATTRRFLLTGKLWPKLFEVIFVPAAPN